MSKQQPQVTTLAIPETESNNSSYDVNVLIKKYIYHWPLFVLGVIICIFLGYYYIKITKPVYPILATLEFKVPTASSTGITNRQSPILQTLDPISQPIIVENEIEVMQSEKLISQVVNKLQLWATYIQKNGTTKKDLYKATPVIFQFVKQTGTIDPEGATFEIKIKDNNSYQLKEEDGEYKNFRFSSVMKSSFGMWQLHPTPNLRNFIDSTILINVQNPDLVAASYQGAIKATLEDKEAPFVNLTTSDVVPERGKDILNSVLAFYQQIALDEKNQADEKAIAFINKRFDSVSNVLSLIDKRIEAYKRGQGITDIVAQATENRAMGQNNTKELNDINVQLSTLDELERYASSPGNTEKLPGGTANLQDQSLQSLYDKLAELQVRREQLLATTPINNPIFIPINRQIGVLKNDFKEKIQVTKSALLANKRQLETTSTGQQNTLRQMPSQTRIFTALTRDQLTTEKLYTDLLALREQISLRYGSSVSESEVVDDAHAGKVKWPIVPVVYGLALIMGLVAPAGLLYARQSLNTYITSRYQIENETGVPILGELAYQDTDQSVVVTEGRSNFAIGEQFRVLRTNLYHLHGHNGSGRVTLFTSSIGSEGKSFISSNLAVTLAYAARKTIILEMDLRKPKTSGIFGLSPEHPGIGNYLNDETSDLSALIQPTGIKGLDIMSCGPILPNPSELLEKYRLDELITSLKEMYDDIIIDTPPIHLVTDAIIIARVTDASLYVVRQGFTSKSELEFIAEINANDRFPKFSIVFNGIKSDKYGYGYSYSNSYYSSYNTAQKEKFNFGRTIRSFFRRF